jgi:hypothetical protein
MSFHNVALVTVSLRSAIWFASVTITGMRFSMPLPKSTQYRLAAFMPPCSPRTCSGPNMSVRLIAKIVSRYWFLVSRKTKIKIFFATDERGSKTKIGNLSKS